MRRSARGQALVELALALPVLLALLAVGAAASAWGNAQLDALERAREAAWAAVAGGRGPDQRGVVVRQGVTGLVRAEAATRPPSALPFLEPDPGGPRPPARLRAALELDTLPLAAGTESAGRDAIRQRWLGGRATAPLATMIKLFIRDDAIRVDFDARPPRRGGT